MKVEPNMHGFAVFPENEMEREVMAGWKDKNLQPWFNDQGRWGLEYISFNTANKAPLVYTVDPA